MINSIKLRILQRNAVLPDVRCVTIPERFRGRPRISDAACADGCTACVSACPTQAIALDPVRIDLGRCTFCGMCEEACPEHIIAFTPDYRLGTSSREGLIVTHETSGITPEQASERIRSYFGKSLKLRQVSAGGCNGCELELNALSNVNFDMGRFGIEFVASPRHADGIVLTGPVTRAMAAPLEISIDAVPNPRIIILTGTCAISGGLFENSPQIDRAVLDRHSIDLFVPGCPPHPLTFITALLDWLNKRS
ncbi:MAG: 4Fe-4S binding protein [Bacteroidota bacterium]